MDFRITIPEPCHEDWAQMHPNAQGRFCDSCRKTVVDFTTMLPEKVQQYFGIHRNQRVCGRFRPDQLAQPTIRIPERILRQPTAFRHRFLLALFVCMGATLFSCADADGRKWSPEVVVESPVCDDKINLLGSPKPVETDGLRAKTGEVDLREKGFVAPLARPPRLTGDVILLADSLDTTPE